MLPATPWIRDVGSAYRLRVLVANSPQAYQEAISVTLAMLRPHVEVSTTHPGDLDGAVLRLAPHLILCSQVTEAIENSASAWIELYPDGASQATFGLNQRRNTLPAASLEDLLAILDGLEQPSGPPGALSAETERHTLIGVDKDWSFPRGRGTGQDSQYDCNDGSAKILRSEEKGAVADM